MHRFIPVALGCLATLCAVPLHAQDARTLISQMVANEAYAIQHDPFYSYRSVERSDRTGGHTWTERVVETPQGRVRYLLAIDGQSLTPEQQSAERGRLASILSDPSAFQAHERTEKADEANARQMMSGLEEGFLLDGPKSDGDNWRIDFRPDPNFSASGSQAKVLHGMQGFLLIHRKDTRLRHVEGRLPADVTLALGLATVHAGSHFLSDKAELDGRWRTVHVVSDIQGKALFFKSLARNNDVTRSDFHILPGPLSLKDAVALAESGTT